ncbi:hypothetical protein ACWD1Z_09255 [Streptomyces sp. NPDC002784]
MPAGRKPVEGGERSGGPGRGTDARSGPVQALAARATHQRGESGESEAHAPTLARAPRVLDGERRTARFTLPPRSES